MIDEHGFRVMPLSSLRLEHDAPLERVSIGVARLDAMLAGDGYFRGGSMLVTGTPGSGKTTLAASFVRAGCERGERSLLFAFEESPAQLIRNQRSVGVDLRSAHRRGRAVRALHAPGRARPGGPPRVDHLTTSTRSTRQLVVIDPPVGVRLRASPTARQMLTRALIDLLKSRGITALCTSIDDERRRRLGARHLERHRRVDPTAQRRVNGERNRSLTVVKARGTAHSNQVREFVLSSRGSRPA